LTSGILIGPHRTLLAGAPEGYDALVLARLAASADDCPTGALAHVARDDARLAQLAAALAFFAPDIEVLSFPAWDCLPYDRVSPHRDVVSRRIDTLTRLLVPAAQSRRRIVLMTVAGLLQRVPPRDAFAGAVRPVKVGDRAGLDDLVAFLGRSGYLRAGSVQSRQYAVPAAASTCFRAAPTRRSASISSATRSGRSAASTADPAQHPGSRRLRRQAGQRLRLAPCRSSASARAPAPAWGGGGATTRSTRRSVPAASMPAWSIGCRCSRRGWKRRSITCPAPR
jgi:hypothetical protein